MIKPSDSVVDYPHGFFQRWLGNTDRIVACCLFKIIAQVYGKGGKLLRALKSSSVGMSVKFRVCYYSDCFVLFDKTAFCEKFHW